MLQLSLIRIFESQLPIVCCVVLWQRRSHASLNGCVTTLSLDGGKCLDFLSKVCYGCQKIEREKDAAKKADLQGTSGRPTTKHQQQRWRWEE